jgi:hypothetical protein
MTLDCPVAGLVRSMLPVARRVVWIYDCLQEALQTWSTSVILSH